MSQISSNGAIVHLKYKYTCYIFALLGSILLLHAIEMHLGLRYAE